MNRDLWTLYSEGCHLSAPMTEGEVQLVNLIPYWFTQGFIYENFLRFRNPLNGTPWTSYRGTPQNISQSYLEGNKGNC